VVIGWNGGLDIARAKAVTSLASGSLLVGGEVATTSGNAEFGVVKLGPTGGINIGFGTGGYTRLAFSDDPLRVNSLGDIVELPDGSIRLAGSTEVDGPVDPNDLIFVPAVAKLTSGGNLDGSFGIGGLKIVSLPWPSDDIYFQRPIHQADGRLLFAGACVHCPDNEAQYFPTFLHLTTAGEPDPSFSGDGWLTPSSGPIGNVYPWDLALDAAGRILVLGTTGTDFALVRLTANGGAIFVAWTYTAGASSQYTGVSRLSPAGELDPEFDANGVRNVDFGQNPSGNDQAAFATLSGGRLVAVGTVFTGTLHFGVSRSTNAHIFSDGFERGSATAWPGN